MLSGSANVVICHQKEWLHIKRYVERDGFSFEQTNEGNITLINSFYVWVCGALLQTGNIAIFGQHSAKNWPFARENRKKIKWQNQLNMEPKPFFYHSALGMHSSIFLLDLRLCCFHHAISEIVVFRFGCNAMLYFYYSASNSVYVFVVLLIQNWTFHFTLETAVHSSQCSYSIFILDSRSDLNIVLYINVSYISLEHSHTLCLLFFCRSVSFSGSAIHFLIIFALLYKIWDWVCL